MKQFFLQKDFQTSTLEKKEKKKGKKKKKKKGGRAQFVINFHESNNSNIFYLCSDREINYIIIIRSNISSNGKNQYY